MSSRRKIQKLRAAEIETLMQFLRENITRPMKTRHMIEILHKKKPEGITLSLWPKNSIGFLLGRQGAKYGIVPTFHNGYYWTVSSKQNESNNFNTIENQRITITQNRHAKVDLLLQTLEKQKAAQTIRELWLKTFPDEKPTAKNLASLSRLLEKKCNYFMLQSSRANLNLRLYYLTDEQKDRKDIAELRLLYETRAYEQRNIERLIRESKNALILEWCQNHKQIPYSVEEILRLRKERKQIMQQAKAKQSQKDI